ncbi:MAG: zinc-dependent peptidase, partial [Rhodanobacter sp.]
EYFAVVSELHYSQPDLLRQAEPAIAELLEAFYGRSPADACESPAYCRSR